MKTKLSHRLVELENGTNVPKWFGWAWEEGHLEGTAVLIDSEAECGRKFEGVALVFDIESPNPGLLLRQPTTAGLARQVAEYVAERPWQEEVKPMRTAPENEVIGYMVNHPTGSGMGIMCKECYGKQRVTDDTPVAVYGVNINPYKATCVQCKRVIVQGCGTELFDGK